MPGIAMPTALAGMCCAADGGGGIVKGAAKNASFWGAAGGAAGTGAAGHRLDTPTAVGPPTTPPGGKLCGRCC